MSEQITFKAEINSPELELLLLLSRRCLTPRDSLRVQELLRSTLDWDETLAHSWNYEVYPLVYDNLRKIGFPGVPRHARDQLTTWYKLNAFRNQHMVEELRSLLAALDSAGVRAIPLKGVTLAQSLYGDVSLRCSCDLDILVEPHLAKRGLDVLAGMGYISTLRDFELERLRWYIESPSVRKTTIGQSTVDLHWALLWDSTVDKPALTDLWRESTRHLFFGANSVRLSPEWEFLMLTAHAARSYWRGIKWLADIHDMCSLYKLDWPRILRKAEAVRWTKILRATVTGSHTLFATPVPPELLFRRRPGWLKLFPSTQGEISEKLLPFFWLDGNTDRLRFAGRSLFIHTPAEWRSLRLPRRTRFLYTPLRMVRLVAKWTPKTIRAVFTR